MVAPENEMSGPSRPGRGPGSGSFWNSMKVEMPTGSGNFVTLDVVADELGRRLARIFLRNGDGQRPVYGADKLFQNDPHWRDYVLFYEYFHGDSGKGLGASHQTGWTALIANLLHEAANDSASTTT